ncbi:glutamate decarboxylase [Pseudomonas sp. NPDC096917]|uniref:glutamate decarboxylase n=1 Tax=Pseudomonas sp. NPDC096917 TaxID=3364483 RepID=UPI00383A2DB8
MALHRIKRHGATDPVFGSSALDHAAATKLFPQAEQSAREVYQLVHDELYLDGNSRQNLATFCQTWAEDEVHKLMDLSIDKNMIDKDEYPQSAELENRCVHMLADLWHSPDAASTLGTSTVGSSEACMLGGLAALWRWRAVRKAAGKSTSTPNMVCGPVQVCWHKFARYWDVEIREVPMSQGHWFMTPEDLDGRVDENTIVVVPTFGQTFTGLYETVKPLSDALDELEKRTGLSVDIHVDGASGAFLAPFCAPDVLWDFRVDRVKSISTSGHKFGLAPLGAGWVIWRDAKELPEGLIFHVNYLGGDMPTFALNFSRPAGQIISQYYNFLRLGREGYERIHSQCYETAQFLARELVKIGPFEMLFNGDPQLGIPALTWRLKPDAKTNYSLYDLADRLRIRGWLVPAYSLPANVENVVVQRILVKQGMSIDMAKLLLEDFARDIKFLEEHQPHGFKGREAEAGNHAGR